jgi:Sec7-like guanine-nucleotide exchange factor
MFSIRQLSQRFYLHSFNRYQSNNISSSDKTKKSWATSDTNGLVKQLSARIKAGGPITVADFMRESLLNPNYVRYVL